MSWYAEIADSAQTALRPHPLSVWTLTDGKIGDRVQCAGLAGAIAGRFEEKTIDPRRPWVWAMPWGPIDPRDAPANAVSPIAAPFPDIVIASGRRAIPYAREIKRIAGRNVFVVILKSPRIDPDFADLVWAPAHDYRNQSRLPANVFTTLTAPHGLSGKIEDARQQPDAPLSQLPRPILGVVLGGPSGGACYGARQAAHLASQLLSAKKDFGSLAITASRRTPAAFIDALAEGVGDEASQIWRGGPDNPYIAMLAQSDVLIVAGDSHNMVSEALATGAGVYVYEPDGMAGKLGWFITRLVDAGQIRIFRGAARPFPSEPADSTASIAERVLTLVRQNPSSHR